MKIQTKTTILFTILTATIFLILSVTVYLVVDSFAHRDFDKRVELRARISAKFRFEQDHLSTQAFQAIQRQYLEKLPEEKAVILKLDANGRLTPAPPKDLPQSFLQQIINAGGNTVFYEKDFRHFAGLVYNDESGRYLVIKSATNRYGSQMMARLRTLKIIQFCIAVLLIFSVGLIFSRKTFQPIRDIINRVKQISQGNLHLRLTARKGGDEIAELTSTFNQMLNRLETAFEAQNNFISNASHELRTPLTNIIGEADYALSKERTPEAYRYSLQQIVQQAEKLQTISKGLLALAQTGFDGRAQSWQTVRVDQLLFDVKEDCSAIFPDAQIQIMLDELPADEAGLSISGNYNLLKTAVNNIVLNACKYSRNQPVHLHLQVASGIVAITVQDKGIGIPNEELKYIYDPFFRASNTKDFEGYGIGMPLANNIIQLHKGSIEIHSKEGAGTKVIVRFPLCATNAKPELAMHEQS
ncbi:sensor histidine kinase [Paracnuella aquatica]|uniref:sensor histidine kinase n=1 Tax=Paracnuella aquatica TaxID=2268757 RepID=UPI000DF01D45|nr:HAMP domain-containing sensor histidine kinase [Paracnuella aquatica]RPD49019.1 sensor histidine kinase [Paracnuella aquatica]